jgi:HSP20 family molecular chaperone IbpA
MTALMPRLLGDLTGWFDTDLPIRSGHLIRMEDMLTDTEYTVRAELPGMDPGKDVTVTVDEGVLTIAAERREEEKVRSRSEFRYGMLQRAVRLPANADPEHVTARYDKGVLTVTVPLTAARPAGRTIPIAS